MGMKSSAFQLQTESDIRLKDQVIRSLQRAYSDEWLSFYQYWGGSRVVIGQMSDESQEEFKQHAEDERRHAGIIFDILAGLGVPPVGSPSSWDLESHCDYDSPGDPRAGILLSQNIKAEECAVKVYESILAIPGLYRFVALATESILKDEKEHLADLQKIVLKITTPTT